MSLTNPQLQKIKRTCKKILNLAGNSVKGNVIELSLLLDCHLSQDILNETAAELLTYLRKGKDPFTNMRINLIKWKSDEKIDRYPISYPEILMGRAITAKEVTETDSKNNLDTLLPILRKSYPKTKIVFFLTERERYFSDEKFVKEFIDPEYFKKILTILPDGEIIYPLNIESFGDSTIVSETVSEAASAIDSIAASETDSSTTTLDVSDSNNEAASFENTDILTIAETDNN